MPDVLKDILDHKRREVDASKARLPFRELEALVAQAEPPRNFFAAVTTHPFQGHTSVIAEVKRRSPSAGWLRPEYESEDFDPAWVASRYQANGAAAISCLTESAFFGGQLAYIERIKAAVRLPVLRKDFIIDPWQLWESRAHGADAVLLIAECLNESELVDMLILAQQLHLTTLLETHDMDNLLKVRPHVGFPHPSYALLGVNNRNLSTLDVDLNHTYRVLDLVENLNTLVSESGIHSRDDVTRLRQKGVRIVLVGEHLMKNPDPGRALAELLGRDVR